MKSETLRGIRTMRDVKSSVEAAARRKPRTTNSLGKTEEELHRLESVNDVSTGKLLRDERRRFAARQASVERVRKRLLRFRERLAMTVNRNRALMDLRHELRQQRDIAAQKPLAQGRPQMSTEQGRSEDGLRQKEVEY